MASAITSGRFESELHDVFPDGVRTKEAQVEFLKRLVPVWAIQRDSKVANGKPWVPHEYVVHLLDLVFGATHWSFEIAEIIPSTLPNGEMLVYVPGCLNVRFADESSSGALGCGHWRRALEKERR